MISDKEELIRSIAEAMSHDTLRDDEITAKMLSDVYESLSHKTAANRLNRLVEKGFLTVRRGVGSRYENAYSPAKGYTWDSIIEMQKI